MPNETPCSPCVDIIQTRRYLPPGVTRIITRGSGNFIGFINNKTVLKYPCIPGDLKPLQIEARLFEVLGCHPRIITCRGLTEHGLLLQYATNRSLDKYITSKPDISLSQKLQWSRQATEAVEYVHQRGIIHCDINLRNFLLDDNLDRLLADFQGVLKGVNGEAVLDGLSRESAKSFAPRPHGDYTDNKTDLFVLGSAIYFIMMGHEVFPDLDSLENDDEIAARFENKQLPTDDHPCSAITEGCWNQSYDSASHIIRDISSISNLK